MSPQHPRRADFREGDEDSNFSQFSESGGSLNGPDLFTELPFLVENLTKPLIHWRPRPFSLKTPFFHWKPLFHWKVLRPIPFPKIGSYPIRSTCPGFGQTWSKTGTFRKTQKRACRVRRLQLLFANLPPNVGLWWLLAGIFAIWSLSVLFDSKAGARSGFF